MTDAFSNYPKTIDGPATNGANVTPDDETDLAMISRCLQIGTGGNLRVTMMDQVDGASITMTNLGTGYHPLRVKRVWDTGTTASNIVALS